MMLLIAAASFLASPITGVNSGPRLGEATRANLEAMIVPPPPRGPAIEGIDGVQAVSNMARLHADRRRTLKNTAISPATVWDPAAK